MIRNDIKNAIKNLVSQAAGVKAVYTYRPKLINTFPAVVVSLKQSNEERAGSPAPLAKKHIEFVAQLEISMIDTSPDGSGQLAFDDVLDAIDEKLRSDPTLGGTVLGSTIKYIRTNVAPPIKTNGEAVLLAAVKQFDVTVQVTG